MPVPHLLTNPIAYGHVWTGQLQIGPRAKIGKRGAGVGNIPGPGGPGVAQVSKTFHAYVELYEQCAHDSKIIAYVLGMKAKTRAPHGRQVNPPNNNATAQALNYYGAAPTGNNNGETACQAVAQYMQTEWLTKAAGGTNTTVFVAGQKKTLGIQGITQPDGLQYEATMWYDGNDIYVAFHCF